MLKGEWKGWLLIIVGVPLLGLIATGIAVLALALR